MLAVVFAEQCGAFEVRPVDILLAMRAGPSGVEAAIEAVETRWERWWAWLRGARAERWLGAAVVALAGFFVALLVCAAARRLWYPYDLEWIESGVLGSIARVAHGQPLYAKPSLDYVPYLYAPVYFYVCAWVTKLTGVSFAAPRLVSAGSTLATQALLLLYVRRETRSWLAGIAAAGIFASLYFFVDGWFDIGRVDSLFMLLFLLAIYCTRFEHPLLAAAVWVLAFQTKQSALPIAVPFLLLYWERRRPMRVVMALEAYAVLAWASIAWLSHSSDGWYRFYVFGTAKGLQVVARLAALYPEEMLLRPLGIVFVVVVAAALLTPVSLRSRRAVFYAVGSVVLYAAFWFVRAHHGAVTNAMMPVYLWTLLLFGMALARLIAAMKRGELCGAAWVNVLLIAVVFQMAAQIRGPGILIPTTVQRADREKFEEQIKAIPGEVYVVNHSWDAVMANKTAHAEGEAVGAMVDAGGPESAAFEQELHSAMMEHKFAAIALDAGYKEYAPWLTPEELAEYPVRVAAWGSENGRVMTSQPVEILLPCSAMASGLAARIAMPGSLPVSNCKE